MIDKRIRVNKTCRHDLTSEERIAYTDAVLCLQSKEAKTPSSLAEGAKSRFDDFVVTVCMKLVLPCPDLVSHIDGTMFPPQKKIRK